MKDNRTDDKNTQEIEQLLKNKMDELSSTVDCFDKISARAFPSESVDFSESEFTISDLENITGKHRKAPIFKWGAVVAAASVCIAVLPRTGLIDRLFSDMGTSDKQIYSQVLSEMESTIAEGQYAAIDVPLDYYVSSDVLVTPLLSCPFADCGRDNMNVRLYIRLINGIRTNEVYAVEYSGNFDDGNIWAVAQSQYSFSDEDIEALGDEYSWNTSGVDDTIEAHFGDDWNNFVNAYAEPVSLASFSSKTLVKDEFGTKAVSSQIIYGHKKARHEYDYFYDILNTDGSGNTVDVTERDNMWKQSIYFDGHSAMPEENASKFAKIDIFNSKDIYTGDRKGFASVQPYSNIGYSFRSDRILEMHLIKFSDQGVISTILPPVYEYDTESLTMYFSPYRIDPHAVTLSKGWYTPASIKITSHGENPINIFEQEHITFSDSYKKYAEDSLQKEIEDINSSIANLQEQLENEEFDQATRTDFENYIASFQTQLDQLLTGKAAKEEEQRKEDMEAEQARIEAEIAEEVYRQSEEAKDAMQRAEEESRTAGVTQIE